MSLSRKTSVFRPKGPNEAKGELSATSTEALPSDIFEQRLYAWKSTIKQLILYFQGIAEVEQQSARGYTKVFNSLQVPLKEGHHLLPVGSGGVQDVAVAVNNTSQQLFEHHTEFARCITDQIVGNLSRLKADIKTRLLSSKKELVNHESNLGRERQTSAKIISDYDQSCHNSESNISPNGKTLPTDPWLVHNTLQKQLQKQIFEENGFHKTMISTQKSLEIFEASIVEILKNTLDSYYKWRTTYTSKLLEQINVATVTVTNLTPELEWNSFYEKNQPPLIDPTSPEISVEAINYPNKENPLTIPKKSGVMERQGGVFKSARRDHCFLTPSGYLHGYSQSDPLMGSPDFSIHLPSSVMRGYSESNLAFEIAERGSGGLFHRAEHSYVFKFLTKEDLASWWNAIKEYTKTTEETPFNSGSQVMAPAAAGAVGAAGNTEPITQESRAVAGEPIATAQSTQQPPTELGSQDLGAQGAQQPISSTLQQPQHSTTTSQQQIPPQFADNQGNQQQQVHTSYANQEVQPQQVPFQHGTNTEPQQQQVPQPINNQEIQQRQVPPQPADNQGIQQQPVPIQHANNQEIPQQQTSFQNANNQGIPQQQNPQHIADTAQQSQYTSYPTQHQDQAVGQQTVNYGTPHVDPNTANASQPGMINESSMVGVPGQLPPGQ